MEHRCEKCKKEKYPKNMGAIDILTSKKLEDKGYKDKHFYLCEECFKKLYKFLGLKAEKE